MQRVNLISNEFSDFFCIFLVFLSEIFKTFLLRDILQIISLKSLLKPLQFSSEQQPASGQLVPRVHSMFPGHSLDLWPLCLPVGRVSRTLWFSQEKYELCLDRVELVDHLKNCECCDILIV